MIREYAAAQCGIVASCYGLSGRHNNVGSGWVTDWKMFYKNIMKKNIGSANSLRKKADKNMEGHGIEVTDTR